MKHNRSTRRLLTAVGLALMVGVASPASAAQRIDRASAAAELSAIPVYQVLAKHYPDIYAQMLDGIVEGLNKGRPYKDIVAELNGVVIKLLAKQSPKANVENTLGLLRITREQAKSALARDPAGCLAVLGVRPHDLAAVRALPKDVIDRELALTAKVLEQTAVAPEPPPAAIDMKVVETIAIAAYDRLPDDRLRVAFGEIGGDPKQANDSLSQTAFCEFSIAMFDIMLSMPPVEGAQTFRAMNAASY